MKTNPCSNRRHSSMSDVHILGVRLSAERYDVAVSDLLSVFPEGRQLRANFATVHSLVEAADNLALRDALASAGKVFTDGVPLVWVTRFRGVRQAQRVCGPDVMLTLVDRGRATGLRHYFLGGAPGVADDMARRLTARFPGLLVAGTQSPPFRALTDEEDQALVERINAARPDVLWIGLGSPKQEIWAATHQPRISAPLILSVGAAFNFHSGRLRRAPIWMRRVGLEWLFRLALEPRRLFRRYIVTNTRFLLLLVGEELRLRSKRPSA
jgi:N-acetylglucosaminyldiphosphoundecaprenol N-acetyl-beta-D-mannosaminyltransferase